MLVLGTFTMAAKNAKNNHSHAAVCINHCLHHHKNIVLVQAGLFVCSAIDVDEFPDAKSLDRLTILLVTHQMSESKHTIVALIPGRAGSKRVPDKNIRLLAGHPLIAYSICAALQSRVFSDVIVSTDSGHYAEIAAHYGAEVPFLRPAEFSGDVSPDIEWLSYTLTKLQEEGRQYDCFSILRPTSPFRLPETIQRAWKAFTAEQGVDGPPRRGAK